ncbi:hypothetical protein BZA05DRAFT_391404 [Tricharina praecox]|uniref:uncharacterized protein n=1 Tax=Tricharina praecox TaxID=43433 RepID=UPI002220D5F6|nr:uncharacterized protein BZA05DRAFT_391404 [Tricharina praecox]KAI5855372.1 hypothetical protein BZA05DRAFT_391404 [Tricharina praecox]
MPEVPEQITDSLEHLELEVNNSRGYHQGGGYQDQYAPPRGAGGRPVSEDRRSSYHSSIADDYLARFDGPHEPSPFPRLINPGQHIPPSDEEKEAQIEGARMDVLSSNDPEMQLVWAQDALNYVEIAMNYYTRIADPPARPQTPALEHQIKTDAINVVSFLADQHHPRAEFMRGSWLEFGKFGFPVDKKEAFRCYARAGEKEYARAEYRMGMQFENSNEPQKAIARYERGARLGDSASNYRLGMMTLLGQHGQRQDYRRGCELIRLAAEHADENAPQGAYVYGMLIARELPGIDVPEGYLPNDLTLAREMIQKAAFLGFSRAQLKMGTAYELCQLGCDFNPALSMHYNALAARQGEAEAEMAISKWFLCGHEGVFEKNEHLAYEYAKRAASSGLGTAEFAIGYFYEIGMYVQVDLKEAQRWYAKAAEHGNKDATGRIDGISRSKTLSRKDHENVAVAKIKSRHGSMRGKNPLTERRQQQQHIAPTIEEVDMPDPLNPQPGQYNYPPPNQHQFPPRQGSMAPLNTSFIRTDDAPQHGMSYGVQSAIVPHDAHPHGMPPRGMPPPAGTYGAPQSAILPPRSGTAIPYPLSDRPGISNSLGPRPSSAAGYASGPGMIPPAGTYPPRAGTAMGSMGGPGPSGPFRKPSGQGPAPGPPMHGPGRLPHPGRPGLPPNSGSDGYGAGPEGKHRPPPVDVGFEAPIANAPRSPRPPRSPGPGMQQPGRLPVGGANSPSAPLSPLSPRPPGKPMGLPTSPSPSGSPWAPPPQPQQQLPRPSTANGPPAPLSHTEPSSPEPAPPPPVKAQTAPVKAPMSGKGPKTFEEMGVPQQTKEQDCVIM